MSESVGSQSASDGMDRLGALPGDLLSSFYEKACQGHLPCGIPFFSWNAFYVSLQSALFAPRRNPYYSLFLISAGSDKIKFLMTQEADHVELQRKGDGPFP